MKKVNLVSDTINRGDIDALCGWLQQDPIPRLTKGDLTLVLEQKWADMLKVKHTVFVNSGSSAILLLLAAYRELLGFSPRVVCPAVSWATDVSSPMLLGYETILCDCNMEDLSCDLDSLEKIFKESSPHIFMSVSPLGLIPNIKELVALCNLFHVKLIEDNCESMGSKVGSEMLGSFGDSSVFSLFFGHHLSTIEGGFINTNNTDLYEILISMRSHGWAREWDDIHQSISRAQWGVDNFSDMYTFYYPGLNVRSTDLQAFIGIRALDRLGEYSFKRNKNFLLYNSSIKGNLLDIRQRQGEFISSFAYPVVHPQRSKIVGNLVSHGIEVRPLIAGNIGQQPFWIKRYREQYFKNAGLVHKFGFYLPNHQDLREDDIMRIVNIINEYA